MMLATVLRSVQACLYGRGRRVTLYLPICTKNVQTQKFGYAYSNFHDKRVDEAIPYWELKKHRLHNLEYYDLVETRPQYWNNLYKLKEDVLTSKRGVTSDSKDLLCIKIMTIEF
jgi:hypothetical protein